MLYFCELLQFLSGKHASIQEISYFSKHLTGDVENRRRTGTPEKPVTS